MRFQVIAPENFPGRFVENEAMKADDGEGPLTLIFCPGATADRAVETFGSLQGENQLRAVVIETTDKGADELLVSTCAESATVLTRLTFAPIVGTGMDGRWRDTANAISRGIYWHTEGNEARASLIHALDAAAIAVGGTAVGGHHYVCDGFDPKVTEIADAIARRIDNKRIPVLKPRLSAIAAAALDAVTLGHAGARQRVKRDATDALITSTSILQIIGYQPRNTVEYLTNHTYTDEDI